jgi:chromosome segregation ATPase
VHGDFGGHHGGDEASQAILLAELQMVRNLLSEASAAMAERADESSYLDNELQRCRDELNMARQSWQASEMSLKVQSESVERLNTQIENISEELRQVRVHFASS